MSPSPHANRAKILDVRETRACAARFECRDTGTGQMILDGYAATYEPYEVYGGESRGGWEEQIQPTAFDVTLASNPDVMLLVNHEGCPLARTKSGTLQLSRDRHGLRVRAQLDTSDPDVQALLPKMRRGDMDEMSFGFRVKDQIWDASYTHRTITEISLQKGDVSVVNYGANPGTRAVIGDTLAQLSADELLVELRKLDHTRLEAVVAEIRADGKKGTVMSGEKTVERIDTVRGAGFTTLVAVLSDGSRVPLPQQYGAPAAGITRADMMDLGHGDPSEVPYTKDEEEEGCDEEAFGCPGGTQVKVGPLAAEVSSRLEDIRAAGADPAVRTVADALAELQSVSHCPPTLTVS